MEKRAIIYSSSPKTKIKKGMQCKVAMKFLFPKI